jgi:hypothetical protein
MRSLDLFDDQSNDDIFLDANNLRIFAGDKVLFNGNDFQQKHKGKIGVVRYCRWGYPASLFGKNQLPLCLVEFPDGTIGGEISTRTVEKVVS